ARSFETVVAVAASLGRTLAEVPQQHRAAAPRRLDQHRQRIEAGALAGLPALVDLTDPLPSLGEVAGSPQHHGNSWIAVASGSPGLLVISFDRLRDAGMRDEAHVRLVDAHAEGDRGDDHHVLAG